MLPVRSSLVLLLINKLRTVINRARFSFDCWRQSIQFPITITPEQMSNAIQEVLLTEYQRDWQRYKVVLPISLTHAQFWARVSLKLEVPVRPGDALFRKYLLNWTDTLLVKAELEAQRKFVQRYHSRPPKTQQSYLDALEGMVECLIRHSDRLYSSRATAFAICINAHLYLSTSSEDFLERASKLKVSRSKINLLLSPLSELHEYVMLYVVDRNGKPKVL